LSHLIRKLSFNFVVVLGAVSFLTGCASRYSARSVDVALAERAAKRGTPNVVVRVKNWGGGGGARVDTILAREVRSGEEVVISTNNPKKSLGIVAAVIIPFGGLMALGGASLTEDGEDADNTIPTMLLGFGGLFALLGVVSGVLAVSSDSPFVDGDSPGTNYYGAKF
jgi:hypothetical protein